MAPPAEMFTFENRLLRENHVYGLVSEAGLIIVPTFKPPKDVRFIEDTWGSNGYILESDPHKVT